MRPNKLFFRNWSKFLIGCCYCLVTSSSNGRLGTVHSTISQNIIGLYRWWCNGDESLLFSRLNYKRRYRISYWYRNSLRFSYWSYLHQLFLHLNVKTEVLNYPLLVWFHRKFPPSKFLKKFFIRKQSSVYKEKIIAFFFSFSPHCIISSWENI